MSPSGKQLKDRSCKTKTKQNTGNHSIEVLEQNKKQSTNQ